ncbi:MAG TPA: hypothetical protein VGM50_05090, partial [Gemmatimonadaceae bacterium]
MHRLTPRMFDPYGADHLLVTHNLTAAAPPTCRRYTAALWTSCFVVILAVARTAGAQVIPGSGQSIGSMAADRARLAQLLGERVETPP